MIRTQIPSLCLFHRCSHWITNLSCRYSCLFVSVSVAVFVSVSVSVFVFVFMQVAQLINKLI